MGLNSNYGVDILTKERLEEILTDPNGNNAGLWGPVIEKNGMYYLTLRKSLEELEKEGISYLDMLDAIVDNTEFDPKYYVISEVVSKSTTPDEAKKIIHNGSYKYPSSNCDVSNVDDYIKEVEHIMKKEVGHIEINEDGSINIYDIDGNEVIKGTKITENTDPNADSKYDLSDIEKVVSPETYNLEDKLDSSNKELIEGYLNNLTDSNDIELVLNENGEYVADINGKKIVFDKDSTLIDAVEKIGYEFQNDKSLQDFLKSNKTNKLRKKINPQRIFIDVNSFESAISTYAGVKDILNSASSKYNPGCLTDKLSSAYGSLVSGSSPVTKISQAANLVTSLTTNIRYSLKAYENIDHNLSFIINSIISEIFANNSFRDEDTKAFYDSDLDARKQLLADTIDRLTNTFNALKKEYESKYPNDSAWFDENISRLLMGVGNAFHFVDLGTDKLSTGSSNGQCGASISTITDTVEFIQKNNLIDILKLYSNGSSFKDSGLQSVYVKRFSLEEGTIPYGNAEYIFLNDYVTFQSKDINVLGAGDFHQLIYYNADTIKNIKSYMKSQLSQFDAISLTVSDEETGKNTTLKGFEILKYYAFNAKQYQDDMSIVNQQKYNYKQYQKIMPYEADMNGDLYLEYLVQDWSKIDVVNECPELDGKIQYMSQKELALYFMYRGVPLDNAVHGDIKNTKVNIDDANGYLDAMSDLINQRQGLEDALLRYESYFKFIKEHGTVGGGFLAFLETTMEGYTDGKNKFIENVLRGLTLSSDGIKSASDYRDTFLLSLLSETSGSEDLDSLCKSLGIDDLSSNLKSVLRRNYSVFKSVGTMMIPTLITFTPGVPKAISSTISRSLVALNTIGSTSQSAMMMQLQQNDKIDAVSAYAYSFLSAGSTLLMNRYLSGIAGLSGKQLPTNAKEFLSSMVMQGGRASAGVYTDTVLRAAILGQPIDISGLPSANYEAIIDGMLTAGLLNGITMMSFKLADKVVINFSDKYTSYKDFMYDVEKQYSESKEILKSRILKAIGQEKTDLAIVDSDKLPDATFDETMLGKWLKERDNPNKDALLDLTDRAASVIGSSLRKGHHLVMDPNRNTYYIFDSETGSTLVVPNEWISTHEPGPIDPGYNYYYSTGSNRPANLYGSTLGESETTVVTTKSQPAALNDLSINVPDNKYTYDVRPMVKAFDLEKFLSENSEEKANNGAYLLITGSQLVSGYNRNNGSGSHESAYGNTKNLVNGSCQELKQQEAGMLAFTSEKTDIQARFINEGGNKMMWFMLPESITPTQYKLLENYAQQNSGIIGKTSKEYGEGIVGFKSPDGDAVQSDNFDSLLEYAKTLVDPNKSLPQDKIIIGDTVQNNNSATSVLLNTVLQKNANVITDKDNVPRVKMPDEIKPEDLILVRSTDVLPSGNVVTTPQSGGSDGSKAKPVVYGDQDLYPSTDNRHTIHWAFNGFVKGNFQGAGDWENKPFVLLEPYKYHTSDSAPGGFASDFSLDHDTKLYEPLLLVDSKWYNQNGDAELKKLGIDYKIIDGDKGTCVANVLSELGYPVNDTTVDVPTNPGPQKEFEDQVDLILNENGAKNVGIRPFGGIYDIYNSSMNRNEAVLEYARGTNVNLGQKNVPISNAEFLAIIDHDGKTLNPTTGEIDTTKFRLSQIEEKFSDPDFQEMSAKTTLARQMADQGIRYDVEKKTFYIQDYDSYIKANRTTLDPNSAEMEAAYNAFVKTCYKQYINLMREK